MSILHLATAARAAASTNCSTPFSENIWQVGFRLSLFLLSINMRASVLILMVLVFVKNQIKEKNPIFSLLSSALKAFLIFLKIKN
jgi:hypothetical protein